MAAIASRRATPPPRATARRDAPLVAASRGVMVTPSDAPFIAILQPPDGQQASRGERVRFQAMARDLDGSDISGAVIWSDAAPGGGADVPPAQGASWTAAFAT